MFTPKQRKILIVLFVFIAICSGINNKSDVFAANVLKNTQNQSIKSDSNAKVNHQVEIIKQKLTKGESTAEILQLKGIQNKSLEDKINKTIKDKINSLITIPDAEAPVYFNGNFTILFYNTKLLIFRYDGFVGEKGYAHPNKFDETYHIDLNSATVYPFKALFKKNVNYKTYLLKLLKTKDLEYRFKNSETKDFNEFSYEDFCSYWEDNAIVFVLNKNYLKLYYMGPNAIGSVAGYKIPYKDIMSIIDTKSNLWNAYQSQPATKIKIINSSK